MTHSALAARIAWRYLRAPKSYSAVSAIAIISVVGVAVATAAIICVLSVFNGFKGLLVEKLDILAPDVVVTPAQGKTFADADSVISVIKGVEGVRTAMPSVTDNALAIVGTREMPVTLKGVEPSAYSRMTSIDSIMLGGTKLGALPPASAVVSIGVARQTGIHEPDVAMLIFAPKREGRVNMANPMSSFITDSVTVTDVFQAMQSDYDEKTVICDISTARDLFQYDTEATSVEVMTAPGADPEEVAAGIERALGPGAVAKDRFRQQEINFRMVSIEKWVTFLLLTFILVIASFNIISTLCMLIIEKQQSIGTLSALGMRRRDIGSVFWWESVYTSAIGGGAGIIIGIILCLLQQHFGLIRLSGDPDSLTVQAYPVIVEASDVVVAALPVAVIGLLTASVASGFARSRTRIR